MDFSHLSDYPIIDGHVHYGHPAFMEGLVAVMDGLTIPRFNVVCTPHQQRLSLVPDALHLKAHYPDRIYVFGGLDVTPLLMAPDQIGRPLADYVDILLNMGCDGVKMIEGKPDIRRMLPIPAFDSDSYAPYWEKMEADGIPLVFHVNDPEEFWDAGRIPDWAVERGWFYGDGATINNEAQYTEVLNVLARHPNLKVIFAHFFFLSAQLERLAGYLDQYPNMHVDLTPGIEMYHNFTGNPDAVREFFITYQDRIVYGTDIGAKALLATPEMGIEQAESQARAYVVRSFLETDGEFQLPDGGFLFGDPSFRYRGIALPKEVLQKIYTTNFERLAGKQPCPLNPEAIVLECERLIMMVGMVGAVQPGTEGDPSIAERVKAFFAS
jgi:predicted TIM-barrel fold metal-dependent hydrolase